MKTLFFQLVWLLMLNTSLLAQQTTISGSWKGTLEVPGDKLTLVVNITAQDGTYKSTLDSPDQMAFDIPVEKTTFDGKQLILELPPMAANFSGEIQADGSIAGNWVQAGMRFPLVLSRTEKQSNKPIRPQEPLPPFPYATEEVVIDNTTAGVQLAGTLTIPRGKGPHPAVVLVSGSGPQNRDEEIAGHKPFLVLADFLTRNGIATLRYDDRGFAGSTGDFAASTSVDFKEDARFAFDFLRSQKRISKKKCGVIGHSEGGMIAQMLAADSKDVAFIVLLAAPGVAIPELMLKQAQLIGEAQGASPMELQITNETNQAVFDILQKEKDLEKARTAVANEMGKMAEKLSGDNPQRKQMLEQQLMASTESVLTPWFLFFINYKPADYLSKIKCPVLALNGEKDTQVEARSNIDAIKTIISKNGNKKVTSHILPDLNHLFQTAETGAPGEYAKIEETFAPSAMQLIVDWLKAL
jgi:uncharacterized protein